MRCYSSMLIIVVCVGMSACLALAEENVVKGGTIRGKITDQTPKQNPIEGVKINIIASNKKGFTVKTDANGDYKCTNLPAGLYTVYSDKHGYITAFRKLVVVVDAEETFVDLKMFNWINPAKQTAKNRIVPLLHYVTENMAKRHNLDKTVVTALHQSISELIETAINHDSKLSDFLIKLNGSNLDVLEDLLLYPDIKEVFSKYLSDTQLQDYNDFINARLQREKQAVVNQLTVLLDQEVFLTVDQRKNIAQLLLGKTDKLKLTSINILRLDSQKAVDIVSQRLNITLNEVLTKTQIKIWDTLVDMYANDKKNQSLEMILARTKANIKKAVNDGRMTEKEAAAELDELKKQLGIRPKDEKSDPQEHMKQLLEAKLAAYIEMLGINSKHASQRLTSAGTGVVQQYLETKDRMAMYREAEAKIMKALAARELTPEQAHKQLGDLIEKIWGENITYEETGKPYATDIINHPLYQKAIKDVLSEDVQAQYTKLQAAKDSFHQQVFRETAVTVIDTQLLLNDSQRKQLGTIAANLTVQPSEEDAPMDMFYQLYQRIDQDMLSPWQHQQFELIFGMALETR